MDFITGCCKSAELDACTNCDPVSTQQPDARSQALWVLTACMRAHADEHA
jgi:hypothetical protein